MQFELIYAHFISLRLISSHWGSAGWFVNVCQASWNARQALKMTSVSRVVRWVVNIMWRGGPGGEITYAVYDIRASTELCSWLWLIFWKWVAYIVELLRICPISFNWCQWHNSKGKRLSYFHTVEQVYQLKLHWPYFQTEPQPNNLVSYLYVTIQQFQRLWVNAALIPIFQSRVKLNQRLLLISPDQRTIRQNWPRFILQKPVYPTLTPILNVAFLIYKIYRRLKTKNSENHLVKSHRQGQIGLHWI